jgi:DNA-binding PadR family transcriptional regulator
VADRSRQRSPLAMTVLALLFEEPMHAYRMHELIKARGKDTVVNVAQRNSVYQTIGRLLRSGLIRVKKTLHDEGRPERVVYEITDDGAETLRDWLRSMLAEPSITFPEFPAALSFLMVLPQREAQRHLETRLAVLEGQLAQARTMTKGALEVGVPRLFLIEDGSHGARAGCAR